MSQTIYGVVAQYYRRQMELLNQQSAELEQHLQRLTEEQEFAALAEEGRQAATQEVSRES